MIQKRTLVALLVVSLASAHIANAQSSPSRKGLFGGRIRQAIANLRCQRQSSRCKAVVAETSSCRCMPICTVVKDPSDSACPIVKMLEIPGMGGASLCWWVMQDCDSGNVSTIASSYCDSGCNCNVIEGTCNCTELRAMGFEPSGPLGIPGPTTVIEPKHSFRTNRAIISNAFRFTYTNKEINFKSTNDTRLKYCAIRGTNYALFEIGRFRMAVRVEQVPNGAQIQKAELRMFGGQVAEGVLISGSEVYHVAGLTTH